jgi:hypothetical protein
MGAEGVEETTYRFPQENGTLHTLSDGTMILNLL